MTAVVRRVLVTGGSGFIGSHLVEALLARGDEVIVLDNLSTGSLDNLAAVVDHPRLRFVQGSVLDELIVDELTHECDSVFHLAAAVGVRLIVEQPLRSFTTNIRGSEIVLAAAHKYRRRIVLTSTSEIYGKNSTVPLREDADRVLGSPAVARWAYSTAKAVDEILAYVYHRERGLPTTVIRLFNTVGPRQSPAYGMVIPRLVRQAANGQALTVFGDGSQSRCFCHVSDVVAGMLGLFDDPRSVGEVFNLGSQEEVTILELAQRVAARAEKAGWAGRSGNDPVPIELIAYRDAYPVGFEDMRRRVPDTTKLRELIGWRTTRDLDQILDEAYAEALAEPAAGPMPVR